MQDIANISDHTFKSVKIGKQEWMSENLNVNTFRNGDPVPESKTEEEWEKAAEEGQPAFCYFKNDMTANVKYGKLYNWHAVNDPRGLAPKGWHIPSDKEWDKLSNYLGSDTGKKLKTSSGWKDSNNGSNECGFSALPGGYCNESGAFTTLGEIACFWSSTGSNQDFAWYRYLKCNSLDIHRLDYGKGDGFSCRCLRDQN